MIDQLRQIVTDDKAPKHGIVPYDGKEKTFEKAKKAVEGIDVRLVAGSYGGSPVIEYYIAPATSTTGGPVTTEIEPASQTT